MAVERGEMSAQLSQIEEPIDAAEQVIRGNVRVEVEGVEQSVLVAAVVVPSCCCELRAGLILRPQKPLDVQEFFNTIGRFFRYNVSFRRDGRSITNTIS